MITHYKIDGHLACGRHGDNLLATSELARVKCRNCRNTDVFKDARRDARNAARRAARRAKASRASNDWRLSWEARLAAMPGRQRLPRGFGDQHYV
ncbi:hypothetical protein D9M70_514400 [compost metagenome]